MGTLLWVVAGLALVVLVVLAARVSRARRPWSDPRPGEAQRAFDGKGLGVDELARRLGMDAAGLRAFAPAYREARIPKRSGGTRRLLVPDGRTKALQRRILRRLLDRLRAHPAATGFERGRSIVHNALPHVGRAVVVKLDGRCPLPGAPPLWVARVVSPASECGLQCRIGMPQPAAPQRLAELTGRKGYA
jgi:hypothetical protein